MTCICNILSCSLIDFKYAFTGTKNFKISENTTMFVDKGDTVDLNCTCFRDKSSWQGPDGSKAMLNDTALVMYSDGLQINPNLNITNVDIYFTEGLCHLKINNFSIVNDGIYQCSYFLNDIPHVSYYNIYSKSKLNTLVLFFV